VDECVDPARACVSEQLDGVRRQLGRFQDAGTNRVVDVVIDVRNAIDDPDDLPLERFGLGVARVLQDPVTDFPGEVEPATVAFEEVDDAQRVLVVTERKIKALAQDLVERVLSGVTERRMPEVVTESDRLDEILVQAKSPRHASRDPRRLERMRQSRTEVIAARIDENLRLVAQSPERLRVDDPIAVALERRPEATWFLLALPAARLVRPNAERREPSFFVLAHRRFESVGNLSCDLRH
jgi:hypothetical protein